MFSIFGIQGVCPPPPAGIGSHPRGYSHSRGRTTEFTACGHATAQDPCRPKYHMCTAAGTPPPPHRHQRAGGFTSPGVAPHTAVCSVTRPELGPSRVGAGLEPGPIWDRCLIGLPTCGQHPKDPGKYSGVSYRFVKTRGCLTGPTVSSPPPRLVVGLSGALSP